jgi:uncharacterized protein YjbI with pentapeptide repeats
VPLTGFYVFVPWLFVLLHFNLLIHLGLTGKKLKSFLDDLKGLDEDLAQGLRRDVANFPLAQWMVGNHDASVRVVLSLLVWILMVMIPPFLLLWMQVRFLAFQEIVFTSLQAAAVATDIFLIFLFNAWFYRHLRPENHLRMALKDFRKQQVKSLVLRVGLLNKRLLPHYISLLTLLITLEYSLIVLFQLSGLLEAEKIMKCEYPYKTDKGFVTHYRYWLCNQYRLDLSGKLLTQGTPSPETVNALQENLASTIDPLSNEVLVRTKTQDEQRNEALEKIIGLNLRKRHLRGANFLNVLLPNATLWDAQLQGAIFSQRVYLHSANLRSAGLQDVDLSGAELQGVDLSYAQLQGANLIGAKLEWADLTDADLSFADLRHVKNLEKADLGGADLSGSDLTGTFLDINQQPQNLVPIP